MHQFRHRTKAQILSHYERVELRRRLALGQTYIEVGAAMGITQGTARKIDYAAGCLRPRDRDRPPLRLSLSEREEISRSLQAGMSLRAIARMIGRSPSTVSREVRASGGRCDYRAVFADERAYLQARRPKKTKIETTPKLRKEVEAMLMLCWSPQQIAATLKLRRPNDSNMNVSHETIYKSLFVQAKGGFKKELSSYLRSAKKRRRRHGHKNGAGHIQDMVMISERPAEVEDRAVPGHWEGDLILGTKQSAIVTLVERSTRYVLLAEIGKDKSSANVCGVIQQKIQTLPEHLRRSLTWDQGIELSNHIQFKVDTGVDVYFCDPRSPWQRGTNENTNGLLRQYFPKGTDLSLHDQERLDQVAAQLNDRPRQTLGWDNPATRLAQLLR